MNTPEHGQPRVIGKDIPWEAIEAEACRVKHFTPLSYIEGDKIKDPVKWQPYAVLSVESPKLPGEATIWVNNKMDFRHLWAVFKQRGVGPDEEVLVVCVPFYQNRVLKVLNNTMPRLHIFVFPKGHLEEAYDQNFQPEHPSTWWKPIAT